MLPNLTIERNCTFWCEVGEYKDVFLFSPLKFTDLQNSNYRPQINSPLAIGTQKEKVM